VALELLEGVDVLFSNLSTVKPQHIDSRLSLEVVLVNLCSKFFIHNYTPCDSRRVLVEVLRKVSEGTQWIGGI